MIEFDKNIFSQNVKKLRKLKGMNKYEASISANMFYQYYVNIENGNKPPSLKTLVSIANSLDTGIDQLINDEIIDENDYLKNEVKHILMKCNDKELLEKFHEMSLLIKLFPEVIKNND